MVEYACLKARAGGADWIGVEHLSKGLVATLRDQAGESYATGSPARGENRDPEACSRR